MTCHDLLDLEHKKGFTYSVKMTQNAHKAKIYHMLVSVLVHDHFTSRATNHDY